MAMLIAAACVFLGIHLLISGTRLRDGIVGRIGEQAYLGAFSVASLAAIVWLCIAYHRASTGADNAALFDLGPGFRSFAIPVVALAFFLAVPGILAPNPTSVGQTGVVVRGALRITRHPFLWGVAIWSAFHLAGSVMLASVVFFATFLVLALVGTRAIDAKYRRKRPQDWQTLAAQTSNIPFGAIIAGRGRFSAREYFDWRFLAAVLLFGAFLLGHRYLFAISPFPNGWTPF
jgi:uncharacterized membrane protein